MSSIRPTLSISDAALGVAFAGIGVAVSLSECIRWYRSSGEVIWKTILPDGLDDKQRAEAIKAVASKNIEAQAQPISGPPGCFAFRLFGYQQAEINYCESGAKQVSQDGQDGTFSCKEISSSEISSRGIPIAMPSKKSKTFEYLLQSTHLGECSTYTTIPVDSSESIVPITLSVIPKRAPWLAPKFTMTEQGEVRVSSYPLLPLVSLVTSLVVGVFFIHKIS